MAASGKVAYVSTQDGTPAVYVDGAPFDAQPTPFAEIADVAWSPDGTRLAYSATDPATGIASVVVDDGTTQTVEAAGTSPVWSPTGTRIAFSAGGLLQSIAADGSDLRRLGSGTPVDWRVVPAGVPRWPNLVQRPPSGLVIERARNGHWLLGYTSMVDNRGPGILWIRGTRAPGASTMAMRQLVQLTSGGVRADAAAGVLRYVVAPPHYHWHMLGFVHAELRSAGDFAVRVRDHKSGFCLADHYGTAIGVPHGKPRFLGHCARLNRRARSVEEGSSVGYTDRYPAFFHGQQLDVTGVEPGLYWLVHRANENFDLRELRYDDDVASALVRLSWSGGTPSVRVLRTCLKERC